MSNGTPQRSPAFDGRLGGDPSRVTSAEWENLRTLLQCSLTGEMLVSPVQLPNGRLANDTAAGPDVAPVMGQLKEILEINRYLVDKYARRVIKIKGAKTRVVPEEVADISPLVATLESEEMACRRALQEEDSKARIDLQKRQAQSRKAARAATRGSSKQLKVEADENYERSEYSKAIDMYTRSIQVNDETTRLSGIFGNRSAAHFMLSRYMDAISDCLRSLDEDPNCTPEMQSKMFQRAAKAASALGDLPLAATLLNKIPQEIIATRADIQSDKERFERAAEAFRDADVTKSKERWEMIVTEFPDAPIPRQKLAKILINDLQFSHAAHVLDRASLLPHAGGVCDIHAETAELLATAYYKDGFESFDRALKALSTYRESPACLKLAALIDAVNEGKQQGNDFFSRKEFAKSIECYTKAIEADSTNGKVVKILFCNRAAARKELKQYREGIEDCTKAIALDPDFPKAFSRRARCRRELKDFSGALEDFQKAIDIEAKLNPRDRKDHDLKREIEATQTMMREEREKEKDLYHVLGVGEKSSVEDINAAYKKLSLQFHPDKNRMKPEAERAECERKFKLVTEARDTLRDPVQRSKYDRERNEARRPSFSRGGGHYDAGAGAFYRHNSAQGSAFGNNGGSRFRTQHGSGSFW